MKMLEKILLATDFSGSSDQAGKMAVEIARAFNSEIVLLHVISKDLDIDVVSDMVQSAVTNQLDIKRGEIELEGVATDIPLVRVGKIEDLIVQTADEKEVNLIIMGSGEKEKHERFQLGTITTRVIRRTDKPVWVVKNDAPTSIDNILCPVDFSDSSKRSLKNAIYLARKFSAELVVLNVVPPVPVDIARLKVNIETIEQSLAAEQVETFKKLFKQFDFSGVKWSSIDRMGEPHKEILSCLKEFNSDLLMMGTHGRTGINKLFMGSVTEKVIRELPCSFITTKSEDVIQLQIDTEISTINTHYKNGMDLLAEGILPEAIQQFRMCLKINDLHIPAWNRLTEAYEKIGDKTKAETCKNMAQKIRQKLWDQQAEVEIRKQSYLFGKKPKYF
jgi:nucleotide-binding universal stress UspA family protein